jgi:ankyrin repeat protein
MNSFLPEQADTGRGKEFVMKKRTASRTLPARPDLQQLKRQAKELLAAFAAGDALAAAEVSAHLHGGDPATFALHDAQFVLARSYGFDSWPKLKGYVDGVTVGRLAEAVRSGDSRRVRAMLKARPELVNYDMAENNEHRAIHFAVFARNAEMVRLLMRLGADARKGIYPHRNATTAHQIASDRGYGDIVAAIEEEEAKRRGVPTSAPDELTEAIARGEERAIAMLEGGRALIRARNRDGWTQLHVASFVGNERVAEWLAVHGADVNEPGPNRGLTPIDVAATPAMASLLRRHGAQMTARAAVILGDAEWLRAHDDRGGELLTIAVKQDRPEILRLLLDFGLDPDERHRLERIEEAVYSAGQPLWSCADEGKLEMARLLLERGADPNVHVYASGPAMHKAFERKDAAMLELLERHGGVVPPVTVGLLKDRERARRMLAEEAAGKALPAGILEGRNVSEDLLRGAADSGDAGIVRMSLPGVDWERADDRWYWILLQAVWSGKPEVLRLVAERCDVTMRHPRFPRTILHDVGALGGESVAMVSGEMAAILLDAGARMDVRDDVLRSTPLGWACRWGRTAMVRVLLDRGADPVEADAEEWARPRAWAEKMERTAVLEMLGVS